MAFQIGDKVRINMAVLLEDPEVDRSYISRKEIDEYKVYTISSDPYINDGELAYDVEELPDFLLYASELISADEPIINTGPTPTDFFN